MGELTMLFVCVIWPAAWALGAWWLRGRMEARRQ